ncbi:hypothetical protein BN3590_04601 [Clostridium sp. C105KSO15]|nr:hypothetical protein BN3590_04601 [Clostridium sp. C105KSO15]
MKWKHIYAVGLATSMAFSLAACGGKTAGESTPWHYN